MNAPKFEPIRWMNTGGGKNAQIDWISNGRFKWAVGNTQLGDGTEIEGEEDSLEEAEAEARKVIGEYKTHDETPF